MITKRHYWTTFLGNLFENYEKGLYHLLAPFLSPIFFANYDPLTALIVLFLPLGFLTKPLGAILFGYIGDRYGRKKSLFYTILGMSITTALMGLVPTYDQIGKFSPILLILCRMMQTFFSAGENTGGALLLLESPHTKNKELLSSLYEAVGMTGYFLSAAGIFIFSYFGILKDGWRYLFFFGALSGVISFLVRIFCIETKEEPPKTVKYSDVKIGGLLPFLAVTFSSAFSYMTYTLSITFLSSFLPLISSFTFEEISKMNTLLLFFDMLLLPCFGYLSMRVSQEKVMKFSLLLSLIVAIPSMLLLQRPSFTMILIVRILFMVIGVAFAAPFYSWSQEVVPKESRYTIISLGKAIGGGMLGASTTSVSLWLYQVTGWILAPALYSMLIAAAAFFTINRMNARAKTQKAASSFTA